MKLINKLTIWYLAITTFVLLASGLIVFYMVQAEIENEVQTRLKRDIDHAAKLIAEGLSVDSVRGNQLDIKELDYNAALIPLQVTDSMGFYSLYRTALDRKFTVGSSYKIQGKHYYISAYNFIAEPDEILEGIIASLAATLLIFLLLELIRRSLLGVLQ